MVAPSEDSGNQAHPVQVLAGECGGDVERLRLGEDSVFGRERGATQLNLRCRAGAQLRHQSVSAPRGADNDLSRRLAVAPDHRDRVVRLAGLGPHVGQLNERAAQHPAGVVPVGPLRHTHEHMSASRPDLRQAEQWPPLVDGGGAGVVVMTYTFPTRPIRGHHPCPRGLVRG